MAGDQPIIVTSCRLRASSRGLHCWHKAGALTTCLWVSGSCRLSQFLLALQDIASFLYRMDYNILYCNTSDSIM
eukprot:g65787.t1